MGVGGGGGRRLLKVGKNVMLQYTNKDYFNSASYNSQPDLIHSVHIPFFNLLIRYTHFVFWFYCIFLFCFLSICLWTGFFFPRVYHTMKPSIRYQIHFTATFFFFNSHKHLTRSVKLCSFIVWSKHYHPDWAFRSVIASKIYRCLYIPNFSLILKCTKCGFFFFFFKLR